MTNLEQLCKNAHDTRIQVGIFDGDCQIDFGEIDEYVSFLYEKE